MKKSMSYGITTRALQLLLKLDTVPTTIPEDWFNKQLSALKGADAVGVSRLHLLNVDSNGDQVQNWNSTAVKAGHDCALVYSTEDEPKYTDHLPSLDDNTVILPISHVPIEDEKREQEEILTLLCEEE